MASRRSTRFQHHDTPEAQPSAGETSNDRKAKARAPKLETAAKKTAAKSLARKGKRVPAPAIAQYTTYEDSLSSLTPELLYMVLDNIRDPSTIGKLARTSKLYYSIMMPLLHKRLAVAAAYHAHIPKLIRALEPHLTIKQKKQLKKEGKYKGQQERYSNDLDANEVPTCASYVRQLVVGWSDPGRKHEYIVHRYVEEALQNMVNLEILEVSFLTTAISQSIASLKSLKALRLVQQKLVPRNLDHISETLEPLSEIKNLKHLSVESVGYYHFNQGNILRSMLLNSASTLQSLSIWSYNVATNFMTGFPEIVAKDKVLSQREYAFAALNSLELHGLSFDEQFVSLLQKALDFMALRDLSIDGQQLDLFLQRLADLARLSSNKGTKISLRSLTIDMNLTDQRATTRQVDGSISAASSFTSAFDTLTSLEIKSFQHHRTAIIDPISISSLVQAITKHENLRTLKFSYTGTSSDYRVAFLGASSVAAIIDSCPHLQELEFAPQESEIHLIGQAICGSPNLASLKFFPYDSYLTYPQPADCGFSIFNSIVSCYLFCDLVHDSRPFIWEDHFKLKYISVQQSVWELASKFGKPKKGMKKAEVMSRSDGQREVMYKDISGMAFQGDPYLRRYTISSEWLDRVESEKS